jgi:PAS domain S-box-containing protein
VISALLWIFNAPVTRNKRERNVGRLACKVISYIMLTRMAQIKMVNVQLIVAIVVAMLTVFIADLWTPRGIAMWVLYMIPLWLTIRLPFAKAPITVAVVSSAFVGLGYIWSLGPTNWFAITNRILGLIAIWVIAMLLLRYKTIEDRVCASEARFRQMADTIQEVFWMTEPDAHTMTYVSPAYEKVWGRPCSDLYATPTSWLQWIHPDDRAGVQAVREQYKVKEAEVEYRVIRPDGVVRWVWDHGYPVFDSQGHLRSIVGFAMDMTDRKHVEVALRESETRFNRLVSSNIIGILIADLTGNILEGNDAFLEMLGYSRHELNSGTLRWDTLTPPEWRRISERARMEVMKTGVAKPIEKEFFHRDGRRVPVLLGIALVDSLRGVSIAFALDLTDRKESEAQRERLVRQLQEALANIKTLTGLLPICSSCQRVRDARGFWKDLESYVRDHSEADFRQDLCPVCAEAMFPSFFRTREKFH